MAERGHWPSQPGHVRNQAWFRPTAGALASLLIGGCQYVDSLDSVPIAEEWAGPIMLVGLLVVWMTKRRFRG